MWYYANILYSLLLEPKGVMQSDLLLENNRGNNGKKAVRYSKTRGILYIYTYV